MLTRRQKGTTDDQDGINLFDRDTSRREEEQSCDKRKMGMDMGKSEDRNGKRGMRENTAATPSPMSCNVCQEKRFLRPYFSRRELVQDK